MAEGMGSFCSQKAFKLGRMGPPSDVRDSFYQRKVSGLPHVLCVVKKRNEGQTGLPIAIMAKVHAPGHNVLSQPSDGAAGPGGQNEDKTGMTVYVCLEVDLPVLG